jgi:hypothetical protein
MRSRAKDSPNNPKSLVENIGLTGTEIGLGYDPTRTALFPHNPKNNRPYREFRNTTGVSKSFGGRLAQIRAIQAWNSERRAWSSAEELDQGACALAGPEHKRALSSRADFSRGRLGNEVFSETFRHSSLF